MALYPCPGPCHGQTTMHGRLCPYCNADYAGVALGSVAMVIAASHREPTAGVRIDWEPDQVEGIVAAYWDGDGLVPIATRYGVSAPTIRRVLDEHGVTIRPRPGRAVA